MKLFLRFKTVFSCRAHFPTSLLPDLALIHEQSTTTNTRSLAYTKSDWRHIHYWSLNLLNTIFHLKDPNGLECVFGMSENQAATHCQIEDLKDFLSSQVISHRRLSWATTSKPKLQSPRLAACSGLHACKYKAGIEEWRASKSQPTGQQKTTCFIIVSKYWSRQDPKSWNRPHSHLPPGRFTKVEPVQRNTLAEI